MTPRAPEALKDFPQFVVWRLECRPGEAKPSKIPYNARTGNRASTTDPTTWVDYAAACNALAAGAYQGIGFVFTANDPFAFLDLDDCLDPLTRQPTGVALVTKLTLPYAAWETSQSGNGLHAVMRVADKGAHADRMNKWVDAEGNRSEFYTRDRFIAFGKCDWTLADLSAPCDALIAGCVPARRSQGGGTVEWTDTARPGYGGPVDDAELIQRVIASRGGPATIFGRTPSPAALWSGDASELGRFYPDPGGKRPFDNSQAELALANLLAWWTGCNPDRIERLMNGAPLCQRPKWQSRPKYRQSTVAKAVADPDAKYMTTRDRREQQIQGNIEIGDDLPMPPLPTIMTYGEMLNDLVHVGFGSQIVYRRSKVMRAKEDAASEYAASKTEIDTGKFDKDGLPIMKSYRTLNLWIEAPNRTSVDVVTWRPGEPEICRTLETTGSGSRAYNLWTPPQLRLAPSNWHEWVQPFLQHVAYLVPIEAERTRFLQWLAHIFQKPGELPHTCYLFIATATGIGRGTLASMLVRTLRGYVAANADVGVLLNKSFNGRLSQKLLATVDEIREGGSQRWQQQENFKSALVEEERHINPKFGRQYVEKNCCRWLLFSNHMDALPFDNADRRVIVIENPTQPAQPAWFEHLHRIMNDPAFIASIQQYLSTLDISKFKPGERAPMNTAKQKALSSMESEADKAARQFAAKWPGEFSTVEELREFMGADAPVSPRAMSHLIERAGMKSARKQKVSGKMQTVLIVKTGLAPDDLQRIPNGHIAAAIILAQTIFRGST